MTIKTAKELQDFSMAVLQAIGADRENAEIVTEHLVLASLSGVDTHGIQLLTDYAGFVRKGWVIANAKPTVIKETPNSALVSGHWTFGIVTAKHGIEIGIQKARDHDIAVVGLVQVDHIGRLGYFTEMAAAQGMIGFVWAGGYAEKSPAAAPYGGCKPVLHTNPVSIGFPTSGSPIMSDFATTALAGMKVVLARRRGEQVAPRSIIDREGNPTTDPEKFFDGGMHIPFGEHKGYAIMLAAEMLGRVLNNSNAYVESGHDESVLSRQGVSLIVLRADLFQPMTSYIRLADDMVTRIHSIPPAPGFREVLVPGDLEARTRAARERDGIPVPDDFLKSLNELATSLGVPCL